MGEKLRREQDEEIEEIPKESANEGQHCPIRLALLLAQQLMQLQGYSEKPHALRPSGAHHLLVSEH